ncbi:MAG TPA: NAD(P)-dependent oxidoreductase [Kofleriaceae bacterium]|nr:NAD(P)-dependent oxidoreductase [Kofleriaceae bacterium]
MRLLFCGSGWHTVVDAIRARLPAGCAIDIWDRRAPLAEALAGIDVALPSNAAFTAEIIDGAGGLRLIQQPAAGVDAIDLAAATRRGLPVCNAPGGNHVAVAEAALLLMLALARRWNASRRALAAARIGEPLGIELAGRTLGIVGPGRAGGALAERARALGMHVRSVSSHHGRAELLAMLAASDVVSLHCPLDASTRGMIDAEALAALPPGALLINCARGPIIDRPALEAALAGGRLGGVGLDVYWHEPWDPADPLLHHERVIALPHIAGSTEEAFGRIADVVAGNVARLRAGDPLLHRVA